ncbi:MAG: YigZ family protein [Saprospiraceae bacterium]|nr:YigZ family protein [Saprospiraceae bacterium]
METDTYRTIKETGLSESREKASKFFGFAIPVKTEADVENHLQWLWKQHPKCSHICYAYKLGTDGNRFRMVDDGEPSGTAGRPIYGQILSAGITDVAVFVVRYFGGTKLGASGLISAYKDVAAASISSAPVVIETEKRTAKLNVAYDHMGQVMNELKSLDFEILAKSFLAEAEVTIATPKSEFEDKIIHLKARLLHVSPETINEETVISFCTFMQSSSL